MSGGNVSFGTKTLGVSTRSTTLIRGGNANLLTSTSNVLTRTVNRVGASLIRATDVAVDAVLGTLVADDSDASMIHDLAGEQVLTRRR